MRNRYVYVTCIAVAIMLITVTRPPKQFAARTTFSVASGSPIAVVADTLESDQLIRSSFLFTTLTRLFSPNTGVHAGDYYFEEPIGVISLAWKLSKGRSGITPVALIVPEGTNAFELTKLVTAKFPRVNAEQFLIQAKKEEGYLFPDTYYLPPNAGMDDILTPMREHFYKKIAELEPIIKAFGKPLSEVITMASYLEEEARLLDTRRIIAGILWKRINIGMPLQVDSTFQYINGKNSFTLTLDDLAIDSKYNTYKYKGFTPTPISNPGLESILAAVTPTNTKYLYFLTDHGGMMRYAATHDEHVENKARYLR